MLSKEPPESIRDLHYAQIRRQTQTYLLTTSITYTSTIYNHKKIKETIEVQYLLVEVDSVTEKQSMREASEHLLARNREIRPLFRAAARAINDE